VLTALTANYYFRASSKYYEAWEICRLWHKEAVSHCSLGNYQVSKKLQKVVPAKTEVKRQHNKIPQRLM